MNLPHDAHMGFCATPTPDMGGFSVEVRSASVVVHGGDTYDVDNADLAHVADRIWLQPDTQHPQHGSFEIDDTSLPALIAALEQAQRIQQRGAKYQWVNAAGHAVTPPAFTVTFDIDDHLLLHAIGNGSRAAVDIVRAQTAGENIDGHVAQELADEAAREAATTPELQMFADLVADIATAARTAWETEQAALLASH